MAKDSTDQRIVFVGGAEFSFQKGEPDGKIKKIGDRFVVNQWVSPIQGQGGYSTAIVNEFNDGAFGPSSIPGLFSDFAGACAAEATVRWLQMAHETAVLKTRRQRDILMGVAFALAAVAIAVLSFR